MLKVENKSKEEIAKTGRNIGEAFAAEKAGIVVWQSGGEQYAKKHLRHW